MPPLYWQMCVRIKKTRIVGRILNHNSRIFQLILTRKLWPAPADLLIPDPKLVKQIEFILRTLKLDLISFIFWDP
jgi:hypothetical protein